MKRRKRGVWFPSERYDLALRGKEGGEGERGRGEGEEGERGRGGGRGGGKGEEWRERRGKGTG